MNEEEEQELIPPENFAMVDQGIYRSGFPKRKNFPFLKRLKLKTILTLVLEDYPGANQSFNKENDVTLLQFGVPGNKEPFVDLPEEGIRAALAQVLDPNNHPMLIHCNKGKHRTGCLVGCFRKVQHWAFSCIFDEYIRFSQPKQRVMDQQFIELIDTRMFDVNKYYAEQRRLRSKRRAEEEQAAILLRRSQAEQQSACEMIAESTAAGDTGVPYIVEGGPSLTGAAVGYNYGSSRGVDGRVVQIQHEPSEDGVAGHSSYSSSSSSSSTDPATRVLFTPLQEAPAFL